MSTSDQILVFDRALVRRNRDRAAPHFAKHRALFEEIAHQLMERLGDVKREFPNILALGDHDGFFASALTAHYGSFVVATDISEKILRGKNTVVVDEEYLPFKPNSFDLITSNLSLHWVNDLPGVLAQIKSALRPGGLFLAALLGGQTLHELRACLMEAELSVAKGASMRVSPRVDLPTASALMQRAGFELPVTDSEMITLTYPDAFALMCDLRGMGEANAGLQRLKHPTRRAVLFEAARLYKDRFTGADGRIPASFEVLFLHGWKAG
jgi:NADH dehydrogenase [ubiquinone] 1 alpha subcomplex assembly factor 5